LSNKNESLKDVSLEEVAKYIAELPKYKLLKRKIEFVRDKIKRTSSEKLKFFLKDKLRQLIDEKKNLIALAFYERHGTKATVAIAALKKIKSLKSKNVKKSLLR
jgi:hypothetical protein